MQHIRSHDPLYLAPISTEYNLQIRSLTRHVRNFGVHNQCGGREIKYESANIATKLSSQQPTFAQPYVVIWAWRERPEKWRVPGSRINFLFCVWAQLRSAYFRPDGSRWAMLLFLANSESFSTVDAQHRRSKTNMTIRAG